MNKALVDDLDMGRILHKRQLMQLLENVKDLQQAWKEGFVCLHPTDTIPGLSFRPDSELAWSRLRELKGRSAEQTCIALVADLASAKRYWQDLPDGWSLALEKLWPAPLSVIWQANDLCPPTLRREDGSLALRSPRFSSGHEWMIDLLKLIDQPFPTTSVNHKGEAAATSWQEAKAWLRMLASDVAVPSWVDDQAGMKSALPKPSTLIKIVAGIDTPNSYQIIREGALSQQEMESILEGLRHG